jgi:AcrR family transcriptional regulator
VTASKSTDNRDTRDVLLAAAKTVFARRGYDGATVKELADAAEVNVSLISYYFGGKEGLYRSCLEEFGRGRLAAAERVLKAPESIEDLRVRLGLFADEILECHLQEPDLTSIIHREAACESPLTQDIFREVFIKVFETFTGFIKAAQKNGLIRDDLDVHVSSSLFFGSLLHLARHDHKAQLMYGRSLRDKKHRELVVATATRCFLEGTINHPRK